MSPFNLVAIGLSVLLCLLVSDAKAQNGFQVRIDTMSSSAPLTWEGALAADGGYGQLLKNSSKLQCAKLDAQGEMSWRVMLDIEPYWMYAEPRIAATADGGFLISCISDYLITTGTSHDTSTFKETILKLDASGALAWAVQYDHEAIETDFSSLIDLELSVAPDGSILSAISSATFSPYAVVKKLDPSGTLLWYQVLPGDLVGDRLAIEQDSQGGAYVLLAGVGSGMNRLARLNSTGQVIWTYRYTYSNANDVPKWEDIAVAPSGNVLLAGELNTGSDRYLMTLDLDLNGSILQSSLYDVGTFLDPFAQMRLVRDDQAAVTVAGMDHDQRFILTLDSTGQVEHSFQFIDLPTSVDSIQFRPNSLDVTDSDAVLSGDILYRDQLFGTEQWYPATWRLAKDGSDACAVSQTQVTQNVVPSNLLNRIIVNDIPPNAVISISGTAPSLNWLALDTLGTTGTCLTDVGIEPLITEHIFALQNNPVVSGECILVRSSQLVQLELMDLHGANVKPSVRSSPIGTTAISTDNLAPGLYILTALDLSGGFVGSAKVVVE